MNTAKLSEIVDDKYSGRPMLVNFQNGNLNINKVEDLQSELYRDGNGNFIAAVVSDTAIYTQEKLRMNESYNNFILAHTKKTGQYKLIALDRALFNIASKSKENSNLDTTPWQKKVNDLNKYFGSKRSKKITEQNERLKVNVENIKTTLEQTAKETVVQESDTVPFKVDETVSMYKPPINREANKIQDVYQLHSLIPLHLLEELKASANEQLENEEHDLKFCDFVKGEFIKLQQIESSTKESKAQLLLYIDCLINLVKQQAKTISNRKFVACSYSKNVNAYILENFTIISSTGRTRPMSMRDKGICYILVLSMLACNYSLNLEVLAKELKLSIKKLQDIAKVLAFSSKSTSKSIVNLSLPLPPPVSGPSSKKRKR